MMEKKVKSNTNFRESSEIKEEDARLKHFEAFSLELTEKVKRDGKIVMYSTLMILIVAVTLILGDCIVSLRDFFPELTKSATYALYVGIGLTIFWLIFMVNKMLRKQLVDNAERLFIKYANEILLLMEHQNSEMYDLMVSSSKTIKMSSEIIQANTATQRLHKMKLIPDYKEIKELTELIGETDIFDNKKAVTLKFVTTLRGILGEGGLDVIKLLEEHLSQSIDKWLETLKFPIAGLQMVVPKGEDRNGAYENPDYRFLARLFSLKFFKMVEGLKAKEASANQQIEYFQDNEWSASARVTCAIKYKYEDIFPAFHLWGKERLIIFPSINYGNQIKSQKSLSTCFIINPDLIGFTTEGESEYRATAQSTITRAEKYFDDHLFKEKECDETWSMSRSGSYFCTCFSKVINEEVVNYQKAHPKITIPNLRKYISQHPNEFKPSDEDAVFTPDKQVNMIEHLLEREIDLSYLYDYAEVVNEIHSSAQKNELYCSSEDIDKLIRSLEKLSEIDL